jgi:PPOX class probable F420-dependent enzyme
MEDGSPHVTPVWVDVDADGRQVLINTVAGRQKVKNVERNAQVAVSVIDPRDAERWMCVRGEVTERQHEEAREHADFLARKYTGAENYTRSRPDEERVVLRINPHRVLEERV